MLNLNPCSIPTLKPDYDGDNRWMSMHTLYVSETKRCEPEVVWFGDLIIQQLQFSSLWNGKIISLNCLNFGIGGDRVEHVLWRLKNGELDFNTPVKAVVLFVGTNNYDSEASSIFQGIQECVHVIREKLGMSHIIIPTLLPKGQYANKLCDLNNAVNDLLAEFYNPQNGEPNELNIHVVEIHKGLVQSDGTLSHYLFHDYLNLSNIGYIKIFTPVYEKLCENLRK